MYIYVDAYIMILDEFLVMFRLRPFVKGWPCHALVLIEFRGVTQAAGTVESWRSQGRWVTVWLSYVE